MAKGSRGFGCVNNLATAFPRHALAYFYRTRLKLAKPKWEVF